MSSDTAARPETRPETKRETKPVKERYRILVVDDDPDIAELLQVALEEEGYEVSLASNLDALDVARSWQPHAMLLDMIMPIVGGADIYAAMQADSALAGIPVIIMSALVKLPEIAARLNVPAYLAKPFKLPDLYATVAGLIGPPPPQ